MYLHCWPFGSISKDRNKTWPVLVYADRSGQWMTRVPFYHTADLLTWSPSETSTQNVLMTETDEYECPRIIHNRLLQTLAIQKSAIATLNIMNREYPNVLQYHMAKIVISSRRFLQLNKHIRSHKKPKIHLVLWFEGSRIVTPLYKRPGSRWS